MKCQECENEIENEVPITICQNCYVDLHINRYNFIKHVNKMALLVGIIIGTLIGVSFMLFLAFMGVI